MAVRTVRRDGPALCGVVSRGTLSKSNTSKQEPLSLFFFPCFGFAGGLADFVATGVANPISTGWDGAFASGIADAKCSAGAVASVLLSKVNELTANGLRRRLTVAGPAVCWMPQRKWRL